MSIPREIACPEPCSFVDREDAGATWPRSRSRLTTGALGPSEVPRVEDDGCEGPAVEWTEYAGGAICAAGVGRGCSDSGDMTAGGGEDVDADAPGEEDSYPVSEVNSTSDLLSFVTIILKSCGFLRFRIFQMTMRRNTENTHKGRLGRPAQR